MTQIKKLRKATEKNTKQPQETDQRQKNKQEGSLKRLTKNVKFDEIAQGFNVQR